jgi:cytoskeleton protein RodZ
MADTSTNENADMFETPGQILRDAREKLELSTQDIAKRVHLDIKIIESIEKDSQEGMPTATYVRGYLRSYAKIVGADADKIINLYDSDSPQAPPEILPEVKPPSQVSSSDKPVKAFTYLITLGLVLLLLIWYQSNFVVDTPKNDEALINNTETTINGVDIDYKIINHSDDWQSPDYAPEESTDETATLLSITDNITGLQPYNADATSEVATTETNGDDLSTSTIGDGPDTIVMKLTLDSWIEIVDVNNNRLFHDLAAAGSQHDIKGTAPFSVLLGLSKGVSIEFNGKPFDIESYSKNGVARFTLPAQ